MFSQGQGLYKSSNRNASVVKKARNVPISCKKGFIASHFFKIEIYLRTSSESFATFREVDRSFKDSS